MKNAVRNILFFLPLTSFAIQTDFNGYFRAGVGVNNLGGSEACTNAGSPAMNEHRWGNECDLYGESTFNFQDEGKVKDWKFVSTFSYGTRNRTDFEQRVSAAATVNDEIHQMVVRETFFEAELPDSEWTIWLGKKFYRWTDIYFIDFFPLDMSGPGFGISRENPDKSKTRLSNLRKASSGEIGGSTVRTDVGSGAKHMLNYQREEIPWGPGKAGIWLIYALTPRATQAGAATQYEQGQGIVTAGKYELMWGYNQHEVGAAYGSGVMSNLGPSGELVTICSADTALCNVNKSKRYRGWWTVVRETKDTSWETALVYDDHDSGTEEFSRTKWLSLGAMMLFHRGDKFSWVVQAGQSNVLVETEPYGTKSVWRLSGGPEWRWKAGLWNRPVLRAYVAYTGWNRNFRNSQFAATPKNYPFAEEDSSVNVGVQTEIWF